VIGLRGSCFAPPVFQIIALAGGHRVGRNLLLGSDDLSPHQCAEIADATAASAFRNLTGRNRIFSPQSPNRNGEDCSGNPIAYEGIVWEAVEICEF
jgi:hypothetical protein